MDLNHIFFSEDNGATDHGSAEEGEEHPAYGDRFFLLALGIRIMIKEGHAS